MTALPEDVVANLRRENARLQAELRAAQDRQTTTAEVLKVIASSPSDVQPVFAAIAESAKRLLGGFSTTVLRFIGEELHLVAYTPTDAAADEALKASFPRSLQEFPAFALVRDGQTVQFADTESEDVPPANRELGRLRGFRSVLFTPLMSQGTPIGMISVTRAEPGAFVPHHIQLLQTFADQAVIAIENVRLFNETREALERQTATAEILKVIASSPSDVQPVFDAIATSAKRLLGGFSAAVFRYVDGIVHLAAFTPTKPAADEALRADFPTPVEQFVAFRLARHGEPFPIPDTEKVSHAPVREIARVHGFRSMLWVPMVHGGVTIGIISVTRAEPGAFASHHTQLLQTFADQAVIAIENARLFNETKEALERQTATAEILKVIASSPSDVQPVFDAIAHSANRLIGGFSAAVFRYVDGKIHLAAFTPTDAEGDAVLQSSFPVPFAEFPPYKLTREGAPAQLPDTDIEPAARDIARARGYRSMLFAPLMNDRVPVGIITVTRAAPGPFGEQHTGLLQMFADQAVIAIENVRLFNETQEALERETASANILKAIASSPTDVAPVLNAIVESACELCEAIDSVVFLKDGDHLRYGAHYGPIPVVFDEERGINRNYLAGRSVIDKVPIQVRDVFSEEGAEFPESREFAQSGGIRSILCVPLLRESESIGTILLRRTEVRPFSEKQIALLQTFADQAVIAIENVRLFDEVQAKTRDLTESLTLQTATADVLKVISRSAFDLQKVLDTLSESAARLCEADIVVIHRRIGEGFRGAASFGLPEDHHRAVMEIDHKPGRGSLGARVLLQNAPVLIDDAEIDPEYTFGGFQRRIGIRSMLGVPLSREGAAIGLLLIFRRRAQPFTKRHVDLATTFADQAVIAIENVRLFDEVRARTEDLRESLQQQTATADVLKVISRSTFDLQAVLDTLVESAARLCEADKGVIFKRDGELYRWSANFGNPPELEAFAKANPFKPGRYAVTSRVALEGKTFHVSDVLTDPEYGASAYQKLGGYRTILGVPLLREGTPIGVFALTRSDVRPFTPKQVELVESFADQAVIAISNVRLFDEVQTRTRELAASLDDLRTAQDRLVQTEKLASLGQLTAGIAHEIKNPLNFVNNFSSVSAELTEELNDVLKSATLTDKVREEVEELTGLLKGNLQKVVQHGMRADSIVKNMLLHSREGSGDHRPADINALLDESLNLAYHGARAEKPQFNVTLQRDFDEKAGTIEVFPQEITRVFLNLISNGFYAVTKRKTENAGSAFEPVVRATTRDLGDAVEIRIRDNGTGIPAEVKEKMFDPFFTTKPAGEGTGLGLSMSHDIIVKQHGGSIDVATEPQQFTEFTIVLPRTSVLQNKKRGQS